MVLNNKKWLIHVNKCLIMKNVKSGASVEREYIHVIYIFNN